MILISYRRTTNALFNQRFLLGVYAPIILEFIVYSIYISARGSSFDWAILLWALMLIAPALFFYMVSPMLIYFVSGIGKFYEQNLRDNIDSLFIFPDDEESLDEIQRMEIRAAINSKLIPKLVSNVQGLYIDSYVSRSRVSKKDNLLSSFETLFLFSLVWGTLSLADFIGVIVLHFTPITLDFITIDQIDNPVNVTIFALLFAFFTILSNILAAYSLRRLRRLMLETLPIVIYIDEEESVNRSNYIRAINHFPIESLIDNKSLRKHSRRIDPIFEREYSEPLTEAIRLYARNQVAKQQAWRIYQPILDQLKVPAKKAAAIKGRFFDSPFYEIARDVFNYDHELNSLKTDIEYVKNRLSLWDKLGEEEHATALVFLFRSTEQLFKSILDRSGAPIDVYSNFSIILSYLTEEGFVLDDDKAAFNNIRKKRNTLVHQSGRLVSIEKHEIESFLKSLEAVLLRVEERFRDEQAKK